MKNRILSLVLAVLCIVAAIPVTSLSAAAEGVYTVKTLLPDKISGFEAPYGGGGGMPNYSLKGLEITNGEFDGVAVKTFNKADDAEKITAERTVNEEVQTTTAYELNLFSHGTTVDSNGARVYVKDTHYVSVKYYYDTTGRDESDENGLDLTGKKMSYNQGSVWHNGAKTGAGWTNEATEGIVANEWATAVIPLRSVMADDKYELFKEDQIHQYKFHIFGTDKNLQMYKGDRFYIAEINFTSFDPANWPDEDRYVEFYATYDDYAEAVTDEGKFVAIEGLKDLDSFEIPTADGFVLPEDSKFSHWERAEVGGTYQPGETFILNDGEDAFFFAVVIEKKAVNFSYDNGVEKDTIVVDDCYLNETIITIPEAAPETEEKGFIGWKENITGTVYQPGDKYAFTDARVAFVALYSGPTTVTFKYGEETFEETWMVGASATLPSVASKLLPEGKVLVGWECEGKTYAVGSTILYMGGATFTAVLADKGTVDYSYNILYPKTISGFEDPYASGGNYKIQGASVTNTTFNGIDVKAIAKTADEITAYRSSDKSYMAGYPLNLFNYGIMKDSAGEAIKLRDTKYVTVEYYYDTTNRDTTDTIGIDLTTRSAFLNSYDMYVDGKQVKVALGTSARESIVANKWAKMVFPVIEQASEENKAKFEDEANYYGQWAMYLFGGAQDGKGVQLYKGDVFYIKNIKFTSYDPENVPAADRTASFSITADTAPVKVVNTADLVEFTLPVVAKNAEENADADIFTDDYADVIGNKKFIGWVNAATAKTHAAGSVYVITDLCDAEFVADFAPAATITFTSNDGTSTIEAFVGDVIKLPAAPSAPEGKRFAGWKENATGTVYAADADYTFVEGASFTAEYIEPTTVTFTYGENSFTESWFAGTTVTLPELPADAVVPEGQKFAGWTINGNIYAAGSSFAYNGETEATAAIVTPATVYVSATGEIEGVDATVYATFDEADNAIAAAGGYGTIYFTGDVKFDNSSVNINSKSIKLVGFDATATVTFTGANSATLNNASGADSYTLEFANLTVVRGSGSNDENMIKFVGGTIIFGSDCKFVQGKRTTNNAKLDLYIGYTGNETSGTTIINNSPEVRIAFLAPQVGWGGGNLSINGDFNYIINAGFVSQLYFVGRNGNGNGKPTTVNGNVNVEVNGGTVDKLFLGSHKADTLNGNGIVTINGGTINTLNYGNDGAYASATTGYMKNIALVYNIKEILTSGSSIKGITKRDYTNTVENMVVIANNAELTAVVPALDVADYNVAVLAGKATPVFDGNNVFFKLEADDAAKTAAFANGKAIEPSADGLYTLEEGTTTILFGEEGQTPRTVTYVDDGEVIGSATYFAGDTFLIATSSDLAKEGYIFDGFTVGEETYSVGDLFTMPDEDVEFIVNWFKNEYNAYYVSAEFGNDSAAGHKPALALKTVAKAYEYIGANDGMIVIIGDYRNSGYIANSADHHFRLAEGQHITITGKDPYTGEDYGAMVTRPNAHRPQVISGSLELSYIAEHHGAATNIPFVVKNSSTLNLGTGYALYCNNSLVGTQIETGDATSPTIKVDGATQFVTLMDWSSATITGDLNIEVGPNATFSNYGVVLGGDHGSAATTKIQGKTYITVNGNKSGKPIGLSGFKGVVKTELNGVMVLLNETNMVVTEKVSASAGYTNNGPLYVVTTPTLPEGAKVEIAEFGKVNVTLPEGYVAAITGATTAVYEDSAVVELGNGNTTIDIIKSSGYVTVKFEGGEEINDLFAGSTYYLPEGEDTDAGIFYGWNVEGKFLLAGDSFALPEEAGSVVTIAPVYATEAKLYYSAEGSDENTGLTADEPLATLATVETRFAVLGKADATLVIVDKLEAGAFTTPKVSGVLTIEGGKIITDNGFTMASDLVLKNVELTTKNAYKHIVTNTYDFTVDEGVTIAVDSKEISIHAGKQNSDMNGDMKIVLKSGTFGSLQVGPYYVTAEKHKTWTGNVEVIIDGARLGAITHGDGYTGNDGTHTHIGNETYILKSGNVNKFQAGYLTSLEGECVVYNYLDKELEITNHESNPIAFYIFNLLDGVEATFAEGTLTLDKAAKLVSADAIVDAATEHAIAAAGQYTVAINAVLASEGAQIRLTDPTALRFVASVKYATSADKANYGMLVYPTALLGEEELTYALVGEGKAKDVKAEKIFVDGTTGFEYTAAITGIKVNGKTDTAEAYTKAFTVVPYYVDADGNYTYAEAMSYSLYDIAKAATGEDAEADLVKAIIATVEPAPEAGEGEGEETPAE